MRPTFTLLLIAASSALSIEAASSGAGSGALAGSGASAAVSVFRMMGALCVVLAVFFGAAWVFRNGFRLQPRCAVQRKLQVLEGRSIGTRQSIYVVAYEQQRFLIGSTPQGMTLLSQLPDADGSDTVPASIVPVPFTEALMQAFGRK